MTDRTTDDRRTDRAGDDIDRRTFIAAGGAVGATMIAGCASESESTDESPNGDGTDDETESESTFGDGANFRLLVSDMPADIGDFERLDVWFDNARIFDGGGADESEGDESEGDEGGESDAEGGDESADGETDETTSDGDDGSDGESADEDGTEDPEADDGGSDDKVERHRGFYRVDLEGERVDLTEVVGDKAVSVFEGGLSPGTYEKIELHVARTEGVVDGEVVNVKVPSEKLQIPHSFEVTEDEPLEFVFDINVVKRGKNNGYNLTPVISESGVAGKDVDVERVDEDDESEGDEGGESDESDDGDAADDSDGDGTDAGGDGGAEADESDSSDGDESGSNP